MVSFKYLYSLYIFSIKLNAKHFKQQKGRMGLGFNQTKTLVVFGSAKHCLYFRISLLSVYKHVHCTC